jgi:hypothetical protein
MEDARRVDAMTIRDLRTRRGFMLALTRWTNFYAQEDFTRLSGRLAFVQGLFWIGVLCLSATGGPALRAHSKISGVTYLKDVAPILERRCVGCHAGGASIALDTYEGARAWAESMREAVLERRMPPWPAAPGFGDYRNDRSLTPIEIELLTAWIDGRTPLGRTGTAVAVAVAPVHAHAGAAQVDAALGVALPAGHPKRGQHERLAMTLPIDRARSIAKWEFAPAAGAALIQRAVFLVDGVRLGSWVPSQGAVTLPEGVTVNARARSRMTVEIQYAKSAAAKADPGTLTLTFGPRGVAPAFLQLSCGAHTIESDARVFAVTPSARLAGDSVEVVARYRDGRIEPLSVVPRYEPAYPLTYEFREPVRLPRGTVVEVSGSSPGCGAGLDVIVDSRGR